MAKKRVTAEELIALGMDQIEARRYATELSKQPLKRFKYFAFLTVGEAQKAATASSREFVRASAKQGKAKNQGKK